MEETHTRIEKPPGRVEKSKSTFWGCVRTGFAFTLYGRVCLIAALFSEQGCEGYD